MSIVNPDNKKMILSCDGGGIRGLIAIRCLQKLEEIEGKPCNEIFHLMAGTSTGAIIVACLAVGIPAKDLADLYLKRGKEMFQKTPNLWTRLIKWTYSKKGVKEIFKEYFGDKVLNNLPVDILICSKDTSRGETMFFEKKTFGRMLLRVAVESSMSAPTFFKPYDRYIDGGIGSFNNPCYVAAVEAMRYRGYPKGKTRLLSFGTGKVGLDYKKKDKIEAEKRWKFDWLGYVIDEGMDDANEQQVKLVEREYADRGELDFKRYQIMFDKEVFTQLGIPLEAVKNKKVFQMDAVKYVETIDLIARKFADSISFKEKEGVEIGELPKLSKEDFSQYLK